MKAYVINLKSAIEKRERISNECRKAGIDFEIFEAVDGEELFEEFLSENVFEYGISGLSRGVVGCALSHVSIYKKMLKESEKMALILEDDAIISEKTKEAVEFVENMDDGENPNIYIMTEPKLIYETPSFFGKNMTIHKTIDAVGAHGYIVNILAADVLLNLNIPIRFEADLWKTFQQFSDINIYTILPTLILTCDKTKEKSSLEKERLISQEKRKERLHEIKKGAPIRKRMKWIFHKLLFLSGMIKVVRISK